MYKVYTQLVEPPEVITCRTLIQILGRNIPRLDMDALSPISLLVIEHHPQAKSQSQKNTGTTKGSRGDQRREILGCILAAEDVGAYDSHEVGDRDGDTCKYDTSSLVGDVVVVPRVEENGRCGCTPEMLVSENLDEKNNGRTYQTIMNVAK